MHLYSVSVWLRGKIPCGEKHQIKSHHTPPTTVYAMTLRHWPGARDGWHSRQWLTLFATGVATWPRMRAWIGQTVCRVRTCVCALLVFVLLVHVFSVLVLLLHAFLVRLILGYALSVYVFLVHALRCRCGRGLDGGPGMGRISENGVAANEHGERGFDGEDGNGRRACEGRVRGVRDGRMQVRWVIDTWPAWTDRYWTVRPSACPTCPSNACRHQS